MTICPEETIDYEKTVTEWCIRKEFWGGRWPWDSFYCLFAGLSHALPNCHNPDTWAMETNKSRERTVDDVLSEAFATVDSGETRGGITVSGEKPSYRLISWLPSLPRPRKGIHCTLDTVPFRSVISHVISKKFNKLMAVTDLVLLRYQEINEEQHKII